MQLALFDTPAKERDERKPEATTGVFRKPATLARADLDERVHEYTEAAHTKSTRRAYRADWAAFERWCAGRREQAMPASSSTLSRYLAFLADGGKKASTIRRARIAIGLAHDWAGEPRPDKDVAVRTVERGIARVHGAREEGADALLADDLPKVVKALGQSPRDERDRALILLGFAGAFRASELVGLNVEQLRFGAEGVRVLVARSKEDQLGKGAFVDVPQGAQEATCPVQALQAWLERVGRPAGPLFRVVHGTVVEHERMHVGAVSRAVQRACARAGLDGEFSAHSLRVGLATSARCAGTSVEAIQRHGRWQDRRSVERYFRVDTLYEGANPAKGLV